MKRAAILAAMAGLIIGTAIVGYYGFGAVLKALGQIGWGGFLAISAYHVALTAGLGLAWWIIVPPPHGRLRSYVGGRIVRDSGSEILPLSAIGGFIMGARAVALLGIPMTLAIASTVGDVTVEFVAQLGYTVLGLALLTRAHPEAQLIYPMALGLGLGIVGACCFLLLQRRGIALLESLSWRMASHWLPDAASRARPIQQALDAIYADRSRLAAAAALHFICWVASAFEAWLAIHLMGGDLGFAAVLTIESLLYAIRSAAFVVPSAIGVQEGAYVMLGSLFGLPPDTALALSLLKRGRDLAIGVPALLAWQALEGRDHLRRRAGPPLPRNLEKIADVAYGHPLRSFRWRSASGQSDIDKSGAGGP
jgi:glycosyltransferase 2 family protein